MKHYELKSNRYFLYGLFLFLSLLFFVTRYFTAPLGIMERMTGAIMFPVIKLQNKVTNPIKNYFSDKKNISSLLTQIDQLKNQNENLLQENIKLKSSFNYLADTKELDKFCKRYENYVCTAQIILRQFTDNNQYIFIDQGSSSGIELDMIAIYKNSLVGKVDKLFGNYSRITLVTDKTCKIAAICYSTKLKGIYEGRTNFDYAELMHIDHMQEPKEDDLVLSSGEGLIYPAGFSLGRISQVIKQDVNYKILIKPLYNLKELNYCYLIKSRLNN